MKLIALLNWYDESVVALRRTVDELHCLGVTHIIAMDGAYDLFPNGMGRSSFTQTKELWLRTNELNIHLVTGSPASTWQGNEMEKRQTMLELGLALTTEEDWLLVFDADFEVNGPRVDMKPLLARLSVDFADVQVTNNTIEEVGFWWLRIFLRARKGLHYVNNHFTYQLPDGRITKLNPMGEGEDWGYKTTIKLWHRRDERSPERLFAQDTYYQRRHIKGIER